MSFALTERQLLDGSKTVTRRLGWRALWPGMRVTAVRKCMGLKPGEKQVVLAELVVVGVGREPLENITADDCTREGFPEMTPYEFVTMFCKHMRCAPRTEVTRIEFRRATS